MTTYFLNNVNSFLGQQIFDELRNDHEEEQPQNRFYVTTTNQEKPPNSSNISKVLNRIPQSVLKKRLLECDVIIYDLNNQDLEEVELAIRCIKDEEFSSPKTFIAISTMMVWANTPPKFVPNDTDLPGTPETVPEPYTEAEYSIRKALPKYEGIKSIENLLLGLGAQNSNLMVHIVCPGLIYGYGEDLLNYHFRSAWLDDPKQLPYIGNGDNLLPTIHIQDLAVLIARVAYGTTRSKYVFGVDRDAAMTQRQMVEAIAERIGGSEVVSVTAEHAALEEWAEAFQTNLYLAPGSTMAEDTNWHAIDGFVANIEQLREEFVDYRDLGRMSIYVTGPPASGKTHFSNQLAEAYNLPHLHIAGIIDAVNASTSDFADYFAQKMEDLVEEMYEEAERTKKKGTEVERSQIKPRIPDDLLCELIKWRMSLNDVRNRGFILDGWPRRTEDAKNFFMVQPEADGEPVLDQQHYPDTVIQIKATIDVLKARVKDLPEHLVAGTHYTEDATVKRFNQYKEWNLNEKWPDKGIQPVQEWFRSNHSDILEVDTTTDQAEQLQAMKAHIDRNGKVNNYLDDAPADVEQWFIPFSSPVCDMIKQTEDEKDEIAVRKKNKKLERKQKEQTELELMQEKDQLEFKSQPLRYYLYDKVIPALAEALDQVCKMQPENPSLFVAQFLEEYSQVKQTYF